jgi:hypothetical protein
MALVARFEVDFSVLNFLKKYFLPKCLHVQISRTLYIPMMVSASGYETRKFCFS